MCNFSQIESATVGVLALQGAFIEHIQMLQSIGGVHVQEVRTAQDLHSLDALIIPGGESTTMGLIAERTGLLQPLREWLLLKKPVFGTCAGMIVLSDRAVHTRKAGQPLFGGLDVTVDRNYFGTQLQSFEKKISVPFLNLCSAKSAAAEDSSDQFHCVFIRAPAVLEVGSNVQILASLPKENSHDGKKELVIAVKQGHIMATAFHPELTKDNRFHRHFVLEMVLPHKRNSRGVQI